MDILSNYITVDSAYTILDEIFVNYIQGDNNLTELVLNAVGDVYTKEQIDVIVEILQGQIDELGGGGVDESVFTAYTAATETRIAELERRLDNLQPPVNFIYVDDFPDYDSYELGEGGENPYEQYGHYSDEWAEYKYGFETMGQYLAYYLSNKTTAGCNTYSYVGSIEYDGDEYWMYKNDYPSVPVQFGLLPKGISAVELASHTIATDYDNLLDVDKHYPAFAKYLMGDGTEYNPGDPYVDNYLLVDIG